MHLFDAKKRPDSIAVGWKGVILYQDLSPHPLRLVEGQHQQVKVHRQPVHDGNLDWKKQLFRKYPRRTSLSESAPTSAAVAAFPGWSW